MNHFAKHRNARQSVALFALAALVLLFGGWNSCATTEGVKGGQATYVHEEYHENGEVKSRTEVNFSQNEDPETGATLTIYGHEVSVEWGASYFRKLPKSFANIETILTVAGVLALLGAGVLLWQTHFKLAGIAGLTGAGFIGLAATVEEYAWLYALGLLIAAAVISWMLWSAYKTQPPEIQPK